MQIFNELYNHLSIEEQQIMVVNNIYSYEDLDAHLNFDAGRIRKRENDGGNTSDAISASNLTMKLNSDYPSYAYITLRLIQ